MSQTQFPLPTKGSNASNPADYEGYTYQADGNVTGDRRRDGTAIAYSYDALGRVTLKHFPPSTEPDVYIGYDLLGRGLYARFTSATGPGVTNTWDALGRQLTTTNAGRALSYQYDLAGNRTRVTWPDTGANALFVSYLYDSLNRMTQVQENGAASGAGLLAQYTYDAMGERSNIARAGGAGAATTAHDDAAGRLQAFAHVMTGAGNVAWTFGYSPANQLTSSTATNDSYSFRPATTLKTYVANGLNQYPSVSGTAYAYDGRGNLTSDGARAFTYDLENHLLSASAPTAVTMAYDPLGRLQSTTAGGAATNLLYDGSNLVGEYDGAGNILRRYAFGANVDEPVTWYEGAGVAGRRWLHADRQGSTIAWSDASGNLGWFRGYGPYGEPNTWAGSRFAYTGQAMVPEAQLYYYKSRFYDPGIGRFLQVDTVGYASDVNSYAYAHGDPLDRTDASGTDDLWVIGKLQMKFQELQNLINLFSKLKDVVSITPNLDAIASGQNGKKPDKNRQEKRKRGDFCQTLDRKVNETKNNLSDYETGSWRWNSSVALSYDLEVNNARLAEDTLAADSLGIASVATGPASGAIRPVGAALASPGGIAVVAAAGSFGVASGLDAEKRQSEIDALQNRIDQLEAQSAGICRK